MHYVDLRCFWERVNVPTVWILGLTPPIWLTTLFLFLFISVTAPIWTPTWAATPPVMNSTTGAGNVEFRVGIVETKIEDQQGPTVLEAG